MNGNVLGKIEACFYKILILGRFAHRGWARRSLAFQAWEAAVRFFNTLDGVCVGVSLHLPEDGPRRSYVKGWGNPQSRLSPIG